ncbi:hypothetical protein [Escherichia coli]|uniref:hypothetical protein n=1 Tax=Escherichia coli TaxID=562 RepID=UPI0012FFA500|nr:hypothetical protein [Escherichia coli]
MTLVNDTGFDPVFSGSIAESWRQQPCTPSYCCDWEAATMLRAFPLAKKGEGRARLPSLYVTNGAIVIHTQRLKSDPGGNLLS